MLLRGIPSLLHESNSGRCRGNRWQRHIRQMTGSYCTHPSIDFTLWQAAISTPLTSHSLLHYILYSLLTLPFPVSLHFSLLPASLLLLPLNPTFPSISSFSITL